jgi:uncharacterized protein involved in type VI secretion and phage assembly
MNCFKGVVPGVVKSLKDPDGMGRLQVYLPRLPGENRTFWAPVAAPMAGKERGFFFQPEIDDEVLVACEEGDPQHPYVIGFLWNGVDKIPAGTNSNEAGVRRLRTVSGHVLEFDDRGGNEEILLKTQGGHEIQMKDTPAVITIKTPAGNQIEISDAPPKITIKSNATLDVNCLQAKVTASALLSVKAPMTTFDGIVKATTVIAQAVVGSAYTPGPGNTYGM